MISAVINHLWQSSLFALALAALTMVFRANRANVRFGLWLAASVKFLVPFAPLVALGEGLRGAATPIQTMAPIWTAAAAPAGGRLNGIIGVILVSVWLAGALVLLTRWGREWLRLRRLVGQSHPTTHVAPLSVLAVPAVIEPGIFGIIRPVLLLPADLLGHLDAEQLKAIITHELCHWRRRDNLTACIHMLVEVLFWFHPLVWWLGARLIVERERACDEAVIETGGNRRTYAEGILKVCQFHISRPLLCVPGASGGDLKKRITFIMENEDMVTITLAKKLLLAGIGAMAIAGPVALGLTVAAPARADGEAPHKVTIIPDSCPMPQYPEAAKEAKEAGSVTLNIQVTADGLVTKSNIAASSGSTLLDEAALVSLSKCKFGPAQAADKSGPVKDWTGWTKIKYTWKLS